MRDLIGKRTRNRFREEMVSCWTLHQISTEFENEGFAADLDFEPPSVGGQRRTLIEQFYKNIHFDSSDEVRRLLRVYDEVLDMLRTAEGESQLYNLFNAIERDGIKWDSNANSWIIPDQQSDLVDLKRIAERLDATGLHVLIERISAAVDRDPALAVGSAKELMESVAKTILAERHPDFDARSADFPQLVKAVFKTLQLLPDDIPEEAKGAQSMKRLLSGLNGAVGGLGELRNLYGSGHGSDGRARGLTPRHARLAVGLSTTLALFLFETHEDRRS